MSDLSPAALRRYYLFGHPVSASLSPAMQNATFAALGLPAEYAAVDLPDERFPGAARRLLSAEDFGGANVTRPHKRSALSLCATVIGDAAACGAVNTLAPRADGLLGHNTDVPAIRELLRPFASAPGGEALLLGAGGAAAAAVVALSSLGLGGLTILNRSAGSATRLVHLAVRLGLAAEPGPLDPSGLTGVLSRAAAGGRLVAVINATPLREAGDWAAVGLDAALAVIGAPREAGGPRPDASGPVFLDLAYGSEPTGFLGQAAMAGHPTIDGREVLVAQGALSFTLWTGRPAPVEIMRRAVFGTAPTAERSQ